MCSYAEEACIQSMVVAGYLYFFFVGFKKGRERKRGNIGRIEEGEHSFEIPS